MASSSSSSSVPTRGWTYDVFLSFRGEDTRNNFVDHLYEALVRKGISTFKDDIMLGGGKPITPELLKAIEDSRFAVVVLSKNYANSSWCLEELTKIMECQNLKRQTVLPVFYHVDPSDVRGQKREFATAFKKHEDKFKGEMDKLLKWREALAGVANLSGEHISADIGGESAFIKNIAQVISAAIQPRGMEDNLVGIESHMDALHSLSDKATEEVQIIGISGMGGSGKTTIAREWFRRISHKFGGSSFVLDVRENTSTTKDICSIQEKILKDILGANHGIEIQDPLDGAGRIKNFFCNKKVLLVLDDVDDSKQLEFLAESPDWFGPGSRIIITTRNKQLLSDANTKYEPALLRLDQAVELFSRHAFGEKSPPNGYKKLSDRAICYTGHLPLALKVLGSFFKGIEEACVWEDALDRLSEIPDSKIHQKLKLSFDSLHVLEQKIFLDIACFYKGHDEKPVTRMLDSFDFHPRIGINSLINKSLITISKNKIHMHDLIQEMGWQIVHQSFFNSRLWQFSVIRDFLNTQRELDAIEAIVVRGGIEVDKREVLSANVFKRMYNIRLLDIYSYFTFDKPTFLPDTLRWFCWRDYPFSSVPIANMSKLVGLEMPRSKLEQLWNGHKNMMNLRFINLEFSKCLKRFPDVSGAPNVERLKLLCCMNLVEVHESLGCLKRLNYLDMGVCTKLKCLPSRLEMESLETLILSNCFSLERFPELSPCMVKLSHIDLTSCDLLEELPSSFKYLSNLSFLMLTECKSLKIIPNFICELKCLKSLGLYHSNPFHDVTNLCSLRKLDLSRSQIRENDFPKNLHGLSSLEELDLSHNDELLELPASISHLSSLKKLNLNYCYELQYLNRLPSGIQVLSASYCWSLRKIGNLSEDYTWLYSIRLFYCFELLEDEENERYLDMMLKESFVKKYADVDASLSIVIPGRKIPSWFEEQQHGANEISLKLPPKWKTQIMGFAISAVFEPISTVFEPDLDFATDIVLRFENDGMMVSEPQINCINASNDDDDDGIEKGDLLIGYLPFSLFEQMNDDEDWSRIFEGNLVISVSKFFGVVRFGAKVVYKEEVESTQQIKPSFIPSYYWNWNLKQISQNIFQCGMESYNDPIRRF